MAKITFDLGDGSPVQEFDVTLPIAPIADPVVEVDTKTASGVEETFTPEAELPPAA